MGVVDGSGGSVGVLAEGEHVEAHHVVVSGVNSDTRKGHVVLREALNLLQEHADFVVRPDEGDNFPILIDVAPDIKAAGSIARSGKATS